MKQASPPALAAPAAGEAAATQAASGAFQPETSDASVAQNARADGRVSAAAAAEFAAETSASAARGTANLSANDETDEAFAAEATLGSSVKLLIR